jgi:hypothetical protein
VVDGYGVITEDTVEFTESKSKSGLFGGLSEILVLDNNITDSDSVPRDEPLNSTTSVPDGKVSPVGLVGRRSG